MSRPLPKTFDLSGRTALVTGAGGLLGPQHAIALAELGAKVLLADIDLAKAQAAAAVVRKEVAGAEAVALLLDVTKPAAVREAAEKLGRVDILVNNAAIDAKVTAQPGVANGSRLEGFPLEQWNIEVAVGLTGAMLTSQVFGAQMAANGGGVILNIASDLSVIAPDQRLYRLPGDVPEQEQPVKPVTYSAIKHGLLGLTKYVAGYWAASGVRCNALSPGGVYNGQAEAFVAKLTGLIPMGRMARLEEYRAVVQFLCSDASSYMTGQNILMDGGRSIL
jgi:NAD(P)-dependent dehydrogenase (short-subunit alcohol dehydrogenase family)